MHEFSTLIRGVFMRSLRALPMAFLCSILSFSALSANSRNVASNEKIYVSKDAIEIADGIIAIHADDEVLLAKAIFIDAEGLFVLAKDVEFLQKKELVDCGNGHMYNRWMNSLPGGQTGCPFCYEEMQQERREIARADRKARATERQRQMEENQHKKKKR